MAIIVQRQEWTYCETMRLLLKICAAGEWAEACRGGFYSGSAADLGDGFIHLSTAQQLGETAERHFAGQEGLVLVAFAETEIEQLRWEPSRHGQLFPHVYGKIPTGKALWVKPLPLENGKHRFPEGIAA